MKTKSFVLLLFAAMFFFFCPIMGYSQNVVDEVVEESMDIVDAAPVEDGINWESVQQIVVSVIFVALSLAMIAHMVYVKFIKKALPSDYTVDAFKEMRKSEEYAAEEEANTKSEALLDEVYASWTPIEAGSDVKIPFCRKDVVNAYAAVAEVASLAPTASSVVERLNEVNHSLNECTKRTFTGSKTFLIVSAIIAVVLSLISGTWNFFGLIVISSIVYWLASQTPVWMQVKKEIKGKGGKPSFMTGFIGGLFGAIATAKTYKEVTEYSDGSREEKIDNSETWFTLIFSFIVMVVMAVLMFFVAAINYLRNYLIYV